MCIRGFSAKLKNAGFFPSDSVFQIDKFGDPNGIVRFTENALNEQVYNESADDAGPVNISLPVKRREGIIGNVTVRP